MGINSLIQFLVIGREHTAREPLIADLENLFSDYQVPYYAVASQPRAENMPSNRVLAGRWPEEWAERYTAKKYVLVDPKLRYLPYADGGFAWKVALPHFAKDPHYGKMLKMVEDGRRYGINEGYLFPVHGNLGLLGRMTIGGNDDLELTPVEISLFEQVAKIVFLSLKAMSGSEQKSNKLPAEITLRELEVLGHLVDGLTSHEIGKQLNISSHTVDWHIGSLQEKLEARNRQHAVALAFRLGLVI